MSSNHWNKKVTLYPIEHIKKIHFLNFSLATTWHLNPLMTWIHCIPHPIIHINIVFLQSICNAMVVLVLNMCVINSIIKCKGGVISDIKLPESGNLSNMIHLYAVMMSDAKKKRNLTRMAEHSRIHVVTDWMLSIPCPILVTTCYRWRLRQCYNHIDFKHIYNRAFSQENLTLFLIFFRLTWQYSLTWHECSRTTRRLFGSTTRVTRVNLTDMRNINNPALQAERFVLLSDTQAPLSPSNWSALYRRSRLASHELNIPQGQQRTAGSRGGR